MMHNSGKCTHASCAEHAQTLCVLTIIWLFIILQMISAERIMAYSKLESEASLETTPPHQPPPSDWPSRGALVFSDVAFRYSPDLPLVLKNLSFSIKPSEKVRQTFDSVQYSDCGILVSPLPLPDWYRWSDWSRQVFSYLCPVQTGGAVWTSDSGRS